jgi:hypothetical protein
VRARSRGLGSWFGFALAAALGVGLYWQGPPAFRAWVDDLSGAAAEKWLLATAPSCGDVVTRYERASRALGGTYASSTRAAFDQARVACETRARTMASKDRADACRASAGYYARALERKQGLVGVASAAPSGQGGAIGASAAGILGADDIERIEGLARQLMADCTA